MREQAHGHILSLSKDIYQNGEKVLNANVLIAREPCNEILKYNGSEKEDSSKQADVLVEGLRLMNKSITQMRAREMKTIRRTLKSK